MDKVRLGFILNGLECLVDQKLEWNQERFFWTIWKKILQEVLEGQKRD